MFTYLEERSLISLRHAIAVGAVHDGIPPLTCYQVNETWVASVGGVYTSKGDSYDEAIVNLLCDLEEYYNRLSRLGNSLSMHNRWQKYVAQMILEGKVSWNPKSCYQFPDSPTQLSKQLNELAFRNGSQDS